MAFKLPNKSPLPKVSDSDFFTDNMREGFGVGKYGSYSNPSLNPETYSAIDTDFNTPRSYFDERVSSFNDMKDLYERSNVPDINPDGSTGNTTKPKTSTRTPGASRELESKIKTAESRGNLKRAARLQGRQDRRIERQTEGAERIKARQDEKTKRTSERQKEMTKKSLDTSVDGSNLQTKNDSPNNFLGGIAASIGTGMTGAGSNMGSNAFQEKLKNSVFGGAAFEAMQQSQAQQAAAAASAAGGTMGTADQNPMTGGAAMSGGAMDQANPLEGKTFTLTPANMMGNAKPTFSAPVQASAEAIYGSPMQRQMSMPRSGSVTQMSPLNSYENPQTVIDRSHGYVASKAAEAFGKIGEAAIKEAKGDNEDENEQ